MKQLQSVQNPSALGTYGEQDLEERVFEAEQAFQGVFGAAPTLCVRSPGRAEIIGNHTDYNNGYALAAAISRSIIAVVSPRMDRMVSVVSNSFPGAPVTLSIDSLVKDQQHPWTNYVKAVIYELLAVGVDIHGANIYLASNLPCSGGVSSSAALELAIAKAFIELSPQTKSNLELALLCKKAENGELVGTPCGLLDQASVALGKAGSLLFIDFKATKEASVTTRIVSAAKALQGYSFVLAVDAQVKRNLGETGYPARRKNCEDSLSYLSSLLDREIESLREVSVAEFLSVKEKLTVSGGAVITKRVEHIVLENQRVLDAVTAIQSGDAKRFGALLSAAGESALTLYGLDEKTPELTRLVQIQRALPQAIGIRNMGGGFSAITLALVKTTDVSAFVIDVSKCYAAEFGRQLEFIDFVATEGVSLL